MKKTFLAWMAIVAYVVLASLACAAEQLALNIDTSKWKLGYSAADNKQGIKEYCLIGESVENWTELVTVQAFFGLQRSQTAGIFMSNMLNTVKKSCPDAMCKVIREAPGDVLFEWEVKNTAGLPDQYEIDRVIAGSNALWVLHYASKKLPVSPETRDTWIGALEAARLVESEDRKN